VKKRYRPKEVLIPREVAFHRSLSPSSKLIWAARQAAQDRREMQQITCLSRDGVIRAERQLRDEGLDQSPPVRSSRAGWARLPIPLLKTRGITPLAKLFFAEVQLLPGFRYPSITTTWTDLRRETDLSLTTLRQALKTLETHGWVSVDRPRRKGSFQITLRNPHAERVRLAIAAIERRLQRAPFLGEALMREYLTLLVDCDDYEDDASPGFLVNPYTNEELQFDRFYPPNIAFEFNGPQHYGPTRLFPDAEEARRQRARDLIKLGICAERGIRLVIVHAEDLTLEGMQRKVKGLLPLRDLEGMEEIIAYLEWRSAGYRRSVMAQQA